MNTLVINHCPSDELLAAWIDDALPSLETGAIASHVSRCEPCRLVVIRVHGQQDQRRIALKDRNEWLARVVIGLALFGLWWALS